MTDPSQTELRQIKRILIAILVCLIVIALSLAPGLIPLTLILALLYVLAKFAPAMAQTVRFAIEALWYEISSIWRR